MNSYPLQLCEISGQLKQNCPWQFRLAEASSSRADWFFRIKNTVCGSGGSLAMNISHRRLFPNTSTNRGEIYTNKPRCRSFSGRCLKQKLEPEGLLRSASLAKLSLWVIGFASNRGIGYSHKEDLEICCHLASSSSSGTKTVPNIWFDYKARKNKKLIITAGPQRYKKGKSTLSMKMIYWWAYWLLGKI